MKWGTFLFIGILVACGAVELRAGENLLRNGSFEGSMGYWLDTSQCALLKEGAADGDSCVRLGKRGIRSTAFPLVVGKAVKISLWIRSDVEGELEMWIAPSHRETAQQTGAAWNTRMFTAAASRQWKQVSFAYTPTTKVQPPWWPASTYVLSIGSNQTLYVDGVSVVESRDGVALPRRPVEVVGEVTNLPGYRVNGNMLERGFRANVKAAVYNTSKRSRAVTVRWQLMDYEGQKALAEPIERRILLRAGKTALETAVVPLDNVGLMLVRASVLDESGKVIDKSDVPVTVLPLPKRATAADPRERFGASIMGPTSMKLLQAIGFRWSRWWSGAPMGWDTVEKVKGVYEWPDREVELLGKHGFCINYVMYHVPKWAQGADANLPKDMQWAAGDPKWEDLELKTSWDRYVAMLVKRYAGQNIAWEFQNEPEFLNWNPALYWAMAKRTSRLVKQLDRDATFMVNCTTPWASPLQMDFLKRGGAKWIDCYTYHNYSVSEVTGPGTITMLRNALRTFGNEGVRVWFNEGWMFVNSSHDDAAMALTGITGAEAAHIVVRNSAELMAAGQEKLIGFHFAGDVGGRSWWEWSADGTRLWDDCDDPTAAVAAWNVLIDQLGLSQHVQTIRPRGAVLQVFQDERNGRGVVVAYSGKGDVKLELPLEGVVLRNVMGQDAAIEAKDGKTAVELKGDRRPYYLFTRGGLSGKELAGKLGRLDEAVADLATHREIYTPPENWAGKAYGSGEGNPWPVDGGRPMWRFDHVWPDNAMGYGNYQPMVWAGTNWTNAELETLGQPDARMDDGAVLLGAKGAWQVRGTEKLPALVFIAPRTAPYRVQGQVEAKVWAGQGPVGLLVLRRDAKTKNVVQVKVIKDVTERPEVELAVGDVLLDAGQELVLVPKIGRLHTAATYRIKGLKVSTVQAE